MSTLKTTNIQHSAASSPNIVLDANNNATFAGTVVSSSSMGFRNRIINGAMEIDQRNAGASVTPTADVTYTLDRWCIRNFGASGRFSVQQTTASVPLGFSHSAFLTVTTADATNTNAYALEQRIEGFNTSDLGLGSTNSNSIAISFWVRSSITGTYCVALRNNAATYSYVAEYTISAANTWEKKTITLPTTNLGVWEITNSIGIILDFVLGSNTGRETTAGTWQSGNYISTSNQTEWIATSGATFYLTGVQLEFGSAATPFEKKLYGAELQLCQRYLPAFRCSGSGLTEMLAHATAYSTSLVYPTFHFPVPTRAKTTGILVSDVSKFVSFTSTGGSSTITSMTYNNSSLTAAMINTQGTGTPFVAGNSSGVAFGATATSSDYILFTGAEL